MAKKLERKQLVVGQTAELHHLVSTDNENIDLGQEGVIHVPFLRLLNQRRVLLEELSIYLRRYKKRRGVANIILMYLRFSANSTGAVSSSSLNDFRGHLDRNIDLSTSTKSQIFGTCKNFVSHFMAAGHIPDEPLPRGIRLLGKKAKPTFSEIARSGKDRFQEELADQITMAKRDHNLDHQSALTYTYCKESMRLIHQHCLRKIECWEEDWNWVESITKDLTHGEIARLSQIVSFKESDFSERRTICLALQILFSRYGKTIPASTAWPPGVSDFLKTRGWNPRRVGSAFFPTTIQVGDFLTAILSHQDLWPNVDSVIFGLYLGNVRPAFERGYYSIFLHKHRGGSGSHLLASTDPLLKVLVGLQDKIRKTVPEVNGGSDYLAQSEAPMLIHITPAVGRKISFRTIDPSSASYLVRRVIKGASKEYRILTPLTDGGATGQNFRPTHAVISRLSGASDGKIKQSLGHKFLSTTAIYSDRLETQSVIKGKFQDFQKYLVDESSDLPRSGSGYLCSEPPQSVCGDLDMCFECDAKRIVLSSPEVAAEWIAWSRKIEESRPELQMSNPKRWTNYWAVKQAEYQGLIDQLDHRTFSKATELAESLTLPPLG